jgi:hypothetical protein
MAYAYLASAFIGMAINRFRHRDGRAHADEKAKLSAPDVRSAG